MWILQIIVNGNPPFTFQGPPGIFDMNEVERIARRQYGDVIVVGAEFK